MFRHNGEKAKRNDQCVVKGQLKLDNGEPVPIDENDDFLFPTGSDGDDKLDKDFAGFDAKTALVDADLFAINDSEALNVPKKTLWSSIKSVLKTYFDGIYSVLGHSHTGLLPSGLDTQTLRNISGTWTADAALKITNSSALYPITMAFNGTNNASGNPSALFYLEKLANTNNVSTIVQARINNTYITTSAFRAESMVAANLSNKIPICFNGSVGSNEQGIILYGTVGKGRTDQPLIYLVAGTDTTYISQYYSSSGNCCYYVKKDGTIMSASLLASTPLKTDANKNIVSGAFGTTAGTFAEGNHAHSGTYCRFRGVGADLPTEDNQDGDIFYKTGTNDGIYMYANSGWNQAV
jgi:hypothetical protein